MVPLQAGSGETVGVATWPVPDYARRSRPLPGYTVAPHAAYELLLLVRVHHPGRWHWSQTELSYAVDGRRYRSTASLAFTILPKAQRSS